MINRIIEFSATNKVAVFLLVAAAVAAGWWSMRHMPLDAIPDLSDTQVIVYSRWDRSPDIVEDQVTYPIVSALLGARASRPCGGYSDFGYSYVYVILRRGDRHLLGALATLEYLSGVLARLPQGVSTELGPDATGVGWVFSVRAGRHHGAARPGGPARASGLVPALSPEIGARRGEVAPLGGFVRQYQVNVDPNRLQAYNVPISKVVEAVRSGNGERAAG